MTPELTYLVWSAVLTFVLVLIAVSGATLEVGLPKLAGQPRGHARDDRLGRPSPARSP